jgi:16S rRNA (uracil1498-N3)-methyltransferase
MNLEDLPRFYSSTVSVGTTLELSEEEGRHAKVLRLQTNDSVHLIDGIGNLFLGSILAKKKGFEVQIVSLICSEPKPEAGLILAVAPTKNINRFEWIIEKAVEVGVMQIVPINCENSERVHLKLDRLDKIAVSALKQSKGLWKTEITNLLPFADVLNMECQSKWIAHCAEGDKESIKALTYPSNQLICIGPEGDFSTAEINKALEAGFKAVTLGQHRLRTETAAIVACVAANLFSE